MKGTENQSGINRVQKSDMDPEEFRRYGHILIDWIADYLRDIEDLDVLPKITPGDIKSKLPPNPPDTAESMESILRDIDSVIMPGVTHWNHPNFMAYFNSTSSGPGILADLLCTAFNVNGMLWKTCPSSAELEEVTLKWLRQLLGIPDKFQGFIYDTASVSSLHAMAAARESLEELPIREKGMMGTGSSRRLRIYISEQAHMSIEKDAVALGIGLEGIKKIKTDDSFRMIPEELQRAIEEDRINGWFPFFITATLGTTSTTSVDPLEEIAEIAMKEKIWLHVDAAHAGTTAIMPEFKHILDGIENADSVVVNPHKWMFVPIDLSALYVKDPALLKRAFSIVPDYLKTKQDGTVYNYMDYGIQLGRRFRSLKLWFVIRYFGREGLTAILREHIRLGRKFAGWVENYSSLELMAPVPFSTVCFRAVKRGESPENLNRLNEELMNNINSTGKVFLSHTVLNGNFTIRFVVSGIRTQERHVDKACDVMEEEMRKLGLIC